MPHHDHPLLDMALRYSASLGQFGSIMEDDPEKPGPEVPEPDDDPVIGP